MNIYVTDNQYTAIIGTLLWATEMIEKDAKATGLEHRLRTFALKQAEYNRQLIQDLEEQR